MRVPFCFEQNGDESAQVIVLESTLSICDRRHSLTEPPDAIISTRRWNEECCGIITALGDIAHNLTNQDAQSGLQVIESL